MIKPGWCIEVIRYTWACRGRKITVKDIDGCYTIVRNEKLLPSFVSFQHHVHRLAGFYGVLCLTEVNGKKELKVHHHHLSLNRKGRWGITDDFATTFLHFYLFSSALWDLPNSRPVHSLMFSSHLFLCLPCLLPPCIILLKVTYFVSDRSRDRMKNGSKMEVLKKDRLIQIPPLPPLFTFNMLIDIHLLS